MLGVGVHFLGILKIELSFNHTDTHDRYFLALGNVVLYLPK